MTASSLPELNRTNVAVGAELRPYEITFGEQEIATYLSRAGESIEQYTTAEGVVVPPGQLMGCYGRLIHETFFYQTGVHVSSDLTIHRLPKQGDPLRVTGNVLDLYERNGNEYVKFSVNVGSSEGEPLVSVEHVSIYKLRAKGERA